MDYVSVLPGPLRAQHVKDSHSLWGGGQSFDDRLRLLEERLAHVGEKYFYLSGFTDAKGQLLCSLKRYYFTLQINGQPLRGLGLAAIFTHPDFRNRGLAAQLIEKVLGQAEWDAALLYSDIAPAYYQKLGFSQLLAQSYEATLEKGETLLEMRSLSLEQLPLILDLHKTLVAEFSVATIRDQMTWPLFRQINGVAKDFIFWEGTRPVGIFSASPSKDQGYSWVDEFLVLPGYESRALAVLQQQGLSKIKGWLNPGIILPNGIITERKAAIPMLRFSAAVSEIAKEKIYFPPADHF